MRLLTVLVSVLYLVGCVAQPIIINDEVFFSSKIVDDLPAHTFGRTTCYSDTFCHIDIRRETYPKCIQHEVRHGHEGNWHKGYETTWDCE